MAWHISQVAVFFTISLVASTANAQIFKCMGNDGSVSFSSVPCPADKGDSQYLGEVQRTTSPESSEDVINRNLRAAEIMQGRRESKVGSGAKVTVVKDSTKSPTLSDIARDNMERRKIEAENGVAPARKKSVLTNCHTVGKITNCYGSDGSRSSTTKFGSSSSTMSRE